MVADSFSLAGRIALVTDDTRGIDRAIARLGEPEEITIIALFFASDASSFCTDGVFVADGGDTV